MNNITSEKNSYSCVLKRGSTEIRFISEKNKADMLLYNFNAVYVSWEDS